MLSLPAIIIAIQMSGALLDPMPMAWQDVPMVTDHDTIARHLLTQEEPIVPNFIFKNWNASSHKEKVA